MVVWLYQKVKFINNFSWTACWATCIWCPRSIQIILSVLFLSLAHEVSSEKTKDEKIEKLWQNKCQFRDAEYHLILTTITPIDLLFSPWKQAQTYGSFMRMNTLAMKKLRRTLTKPMKSNRKRFSLGMFGALERSRIIKPRPPIVKRKLEASPSIMYCPFTLKVGNTHISYALSRVIKLLNQYYPGSNTNWLLALAVVLFSQMLWPTYLYAKKATGRWCPCSSVIEPTLGGSTITS